MLYRRYRSRGKRRRVSRKTRRYGRRRTRRNRIPRFAGLKIESTFRKAVKFRWCQYYKLDATGIAPVEYAIRANSPYDPDYALGGASALKWSAYQSIYRKYIVVRSTCYVRTLGENNADADNPNYPGVLTLYVSSDPTAFTSWQNYIANARGSYVLTSGDPGAYTKKTLKATFNAKKFFNITNIKDNFDVYGAPLNANPGGDAFFVLNHAALVAGNNPKSVNCLVIVDYWVVFGDPTNVFTL